MSTDKLSTPLAQTKGLGTAKGGTSHWLAQRTTSLALLPLTLWFVFKVISLVDEPYDSVLASLSSPFAAVALLLLTGALFYHGYLGLHEVFEDYIHHKGLKFTAILLSQFIFISLALICILSILRIYLL